MKINRLWNIPAILVLGIFLCLSPIITNAQDLSGYIVKINGINHSLNEVLDDLSKQTGFYFTYDSRLINSNALCSISCPSISLDKAIDTLFNFPNINWQLINKNIVIYPEYQNITTKSSSISKRPGYITIVGKVIEKKSKKHLPYATIAVKNTYYGTISNNDGTFMLKIPDTIQNPIIVSTFIGYKNQYTPVSINSRDSILISLSKNLISLQEVVIRYKDPVKLMEESIKRISDNYMNVPSGYIAYYREKVQKDNKCLLFSEAVVEIAKTPYGKSFKNEKTKLLKGRKITNVSIQDSVLMKISSGINSMLQLDIINHLPDFLSENFINRYKVTFSNVESYKDQLVYVISFEQKDYIDEMLFRGQLYLNMNTLAIVAADFEYDPLKIRHEPDIFVSKKSRRLHIKPLSANYHVEYRSNQGTYHLSQVQGEVKFRIRQKRKWLSSKYEINLDLAVTNVKPNAPPNIKNVNQLKPSTVLSEVNFKYDPDFWGDYTTISPETSLQESIDMIQEAIVEISRESAKSE